MAPTLRQAVQVVLRAQPALWLLLAGWTLLAVVSAYAIEVYAESGTTCGSLLRRRSPDPLCQEHFDHRDFIVSFFTAVAVALAACAVAASWASWRRSSEPVATRGPLARRQRLAAEAFWWSLALPFFGLPVLVLGQFSRGTATGVILSGLPTGWSHLALASGLTGLCLTVGGRCGLHRRAALAAAATALPLAFAMQAWLGYQFEGFAPDETARLASPPAWWLIAPVLWLCLIGAAELQRRGSRAPNEWWTTAVLLVSTAVATVVLIPQLLPGWRDARGGRPFPSGGPGMDTWLPVLIATAVGCALAVAIGYAFARRGGRQAQRV